MIIFPRGHRSGYSDQCKAFASMLSNCAKVSDCPVMLMVEGGRSKLFANTTKARLAISMKDSFCMANG